MTPYYSNSHCEYCGVRTLYLPLVKVECCTDDIAAMSDADLAAFVGQHHVVICNGVPLDDFY